MNSPSNKNTPQKLKKPAEQLNSPLINPKEFDEKLKKLIIRLSRQNICKEHKLIANMNLKLEVLLEHVLKLEELKNLKLDDAIKMINKVPFLEWVNENCKFFFILVDSFGQIQTNQKAHMSNSKNSFMTNELMKLGDKELLRLTYPNSQRTVILTGITKPWTEAAIRDYNPILGDHFVKQNSYKKTPSMHHHSTCQILGSNEFWIAIEADNTGNALAFKKFIRQRKKAFEERRDFSFKEEKKRVRIVMQNQDFYTLLVDAMTEKKNIEFTKRLVNPNSGMFPSMCLRDTKKTSYPNEEYQMDQKKINRVLYFPIIFNRPETKQSDQHFALQDVYSEDRSKMSDMLDSINSMNDLIEKADQGTQAESLGVGTQDFLTSTEDLGSMDDIQLLGSVKEASPMKSNLLGSENFKSENAPSQNESPEREKSNSTKKLQEKIKNNEDESQSDLDSGPQISTKQNPDYLQVTKLHSNNPKITSDYWEKPGDPPKGVQTQNNPLMATNPTILTPVSLFSVREPQLPTKLLKLSFSLHSQTMMTQISYTKMKRLEAEYQKKSVNRLKLAPGIPEQFRQVSYEMRNKQLFVQNLLNSMEKSSQKKDFSLYH